MKRYVSGSEQDFTTLGVLLSPEHPRRYWDYVLSIRIGPSYSGASIPWQAFQGYHDWLHWAREFRWRGCIGRKLLELRVGSMRRIEAFGLLFEGGACRMDIHTLKDSSNQVSGIRWQTAKSLAWWMDSRFSGQNNSSIIKIHLVHWFAAHNSVTCIEPGAAGTQKMKGVPNTLLKEISKEATNLQYLQVASQHTYDIYKLARILPIKMLVLKYIRAPMDFVKHDLNIMLP